MLIADVLRTKGSEVKRIRESETVAEAVRLMSEHRIGALVVEDQWMKPKGIFSERDFVNASARHGAMILNWRVDRLMSAPIISATSSQRVDQALAMMTMARIRHLPVIDGDTLRGIVSIGDLVKHRLDEKELEAGVLLEMMRMRA